MRPRERDYDWLWSVDRQLANVDVVNATLDDITDIGNAIRTHESYARHTRTTRAEIGAKLSLLRGLVSQSYISVYCVPNADGVDELYAYSSATAEFFPLYKVAYTAYELCVMYKCGWATMVTVRKPSVR